MDVYSSEEEQVEAIKKWWKENGMAIITGIILGLGSLFGWRYWQTQEQIKGEEASTGFQEVRSLLTENHTADAILIGDQVINRFGESTYSALTALAIAKIEVGERDFDAAETRLQWVIDNATLNEIKDIAQRRLARVYLAQGNNDKAWATISGQQTEPAQVSLHELRGDILVARNEIDEARREYIKALSLAEATQADFAILQLKLDDLGSAGSDQIPPN